MKAFCGKRLLDKAVECGLHALDGLREPVILTPFTAIANEIEDIKQKLDESSFNVKSLGQVRNEYKLAALRLLNEISLIFYLFMPNYL